MLRFIILKLQLVKEIASQWTACKIVHGKPRHSQSQGSVERANRDVEDKLACWLRDNKPKQWSEGLSYVQFQKNSSFHSGIGRSPYEAMFGVPPKCGILDLNLPSAAVEDVVSEEQLQLVIDRNQDQDPVHNEEGMPLNHPIEH